MSEQPTAYLVIDDHGIVIATLDRGRALERAVHIDAVVAELPVIADYRNPGNPT